ncbi:MAG: redoxin domain-containing protein [SAR202 cluster bacterium]|nr:redoxin domain-containing protein [SAR202 cluster bacterium]
MPQKLAQGDKLPRLSLSLTDGRAVTLPDDMTGRYLVLLFYRGNW